MNVLTRRIKGKNGDDASREEEEKEKEEKGGGGGDEKKEEEKEEEEEKQSSSSESLDELLFPGWWEWLLMDWFSEVLFQSQKYAGFVSGEYKKWKDSFGLVAPNEQIGNTVSGAIYFLKNAISFEVWKKFLLSSFFFFSSLFIISKPFLLLKLKFFVVVENIHCRQ